jgi:type VI protein secretion system component Hcp
MIIIVLKLYRDIKPLGLDVHDADLTFEKSFNKSSPSLKKHSFSGLYPQPKNKVIIKSDKSTNASFNFLMSTKLKRQE